MRKRQGKGSAMDRHEGRVVLSDAMIENPLTTDGLVAAAIVAGHRQPRWVRAEINLVSMIGGLARLKRLSEAEIAAAGRYRALSELAEIGRSRGTDYASPVVDTSPGGRDLAVMSASARRELAIVRRALGPFQASLLDRIICEERSLRDLAKGGQALLLTGKRVRAATADLVRIFDGSRRRVRGTGERASDWSVASVDGGEESA